MKPAPFAYVAPSSTADAVAVLAKHGSDSKVLAGGQSLVPLLNFRLARPEMLVDVNRIGALAYIRRRDGSLHIGAMTRQRTMEESRVVAAHWPLLTGATRYVAHPQIRNRGTVGGSVAHADPAAELPVALTTLDATFHAQSARGRRTIQAREFFLAQLTTALEPDELLVEIEVPELPRRTGHAFVEYARRHGDFGLGGAAALITLADDGRCTQAALTLLGAGPVPLRATAVEESLVGHDVDERVADAAAAAAVAEVRPTGDVHASSAYRRSLIETLTARAVRVASARARQVPDAS